MKYIKTIEGWKQNLAAGLSLFGSVAMGANSGDDKNPKPKTELSTNKEKQFTGEGISIDLSAAKKIAILNAKKQIGNKKYKIVDEHVYKLEDGNYKSVVIISTFL